VRSSDGLAAIPGASVRIVPSLLPVPADAFPMVNAGVDGRFVFDGVPEGPFTVVAFDRLSPFSGQAAGAITGEGDVARVEIRIEGFGTVRGRVLEADGATPATEADVILEGAGGRRTAVETEPGQEGEFAFEQVPVARFGRAVEHTLTAVSRVPGEALNAVRAGPLTLARHGDAVEVELVLNGLGTVEVTVVDANGVSVPLANVVLQAGGPIDGELATGTDALGGPAIIPGVPVGEFTVKADAPGLRVAGALTGAVAAPGDTERVTVVLSEAGAIRGRLLLPDATTPVPDAFVTLRLPAVVGTGLLQTLTDAEGRFAFESIPLGDFRIEVFEPLSQGRRLARGSLAFQDDLAELGDLLLDLEAPAVVATDPPQGASGVPVDATVRLTFNEPLLASTVTLDTSPGTSTPTGSLALVGPDGTKLAADLRLLDGDRTVEIVPNAPLASEAGYQVVALNGPQGILDAAAERELAAPLTRCRRRSSPCRPRPGGRTTCRRRRWCASPSTSRWAMPSTSSSSATGCPSRARCPCSSAARWRCSPRARPSPSTRATRTG